MLFLATILAGCFVLVAWHYWKRLGDSEAFAAEDQRLFLRWLAAGLVLPLSFWLLLNLGLAGPPVWPAVTSLRAGVGAWWTSFHAPAASGMFLVSSYWAGVTFAWLLWQLSERIAERRTFLRICMAWSFVLVPFAALIVAAGRWPAVGIVLMLCCLALVHVTLALKEIKPSLPSYARAQARINFGNYEEAEMEVIRELEQYEDDFEGWMMLAELYATHFHDVPAADQTVSDLCEQTAVTPVQVGIALNRLADWHLKLAHDPVAARATLTRLCERLAGTHMERMARQRIAQLPATREALLEQERGRTLRLPAAADDHPPPVEPLSRDDAERHAHACVAALNRNPDDLPARERFARLLAEHLGNTAIAIEQMELLLALPDQPETKRAEWLMAIAGWQARENPARAQLVYERIVRDHPKTAQGFAAQRRLNLIHLQSEFRRRSAGRRETA